MEDIRANQTLAALCTGRHRAASLVTGFAVMSPTSEERTELDIEFGGNEAGAFPMPTGGLGMQYGSQQQLNQGLATSLMNGDNAAFLGSGSQPSFVPEMIARGPFFDPTLPGTTPPFVSGSDRSATFMDLLHSPSTTLSDLSGPPNSRNLERGAHLTLPGIPASWAEIVDAVQKASAMAEAARMDAAVARTEAEAAHAEAEAARAEVVRAKEHVLSLEAKLDVQRESSVGPELTPKRASRTPWNAKVEKLIHQKLISMLGLTYNGRGKYTVPDFPEDTRELVIPAEGEAMTWTPIWTKAITESEYNSAFIDRAQKLLVNAEEHLPVEQQVFLALSASERRIAVIRYFQTLADSYKNQKDPERKAKKATRQFNHTKYRRRDRAAQDWLAVAARVEELLSQHLKKPMEEVCGVAHLIKASWLDEIHDTAGNATIEAWNARKAAAGGGTQPAWEVRRLRWKSQFLRRIHLLLHKTSLDARRAESSGAAATFTFPGLPINAIDGGPPRKELPWRKCVNTAWINRQPHGQCWREDDIQLVPILAIDIPDSMFNDEDLLWLEEDELDGVVAHSAGPADT